MLIFITLLNNKVLMHSCCFNIHVFRFLQMAMTESDAHFSLSLRARCYICSRTVNFSCKLTCYHCNRLCQKICNKYDLCNNSEWFCNFCISAELPFHSINNTKLKQFLSQHNLVDISNHVLENINQWLFNPVTDHLCQL